VKLLFDQNISFRILSKIRELYPNAHQVRELQLENKSDIEIWNFAKSQQFNIETFDADFFEIANLKGHLPKIIWLRFGNTTTTNIAQVLCDKYQIIRDFIENPDYSELACLEID
jgi:predicted nuclease of predicted toxin-antitoxin system